MPTSAMSRAFRSPSCGNCAWAWIPPYRRSPTQTMEVGMARQKVSAQRDLFAPPEPGTALAPDVAKRLLPLLERLLLEVMATEPTTTEGSGEQDHA